MKHFHIETRKDRMGLIGDICIALSSRKTDANGNEYIAIGQEWTTKRELEQLVMKLKGDLDAVLVAGRREFAKLPAKA